MEKIFTFLRNAITPIKNSVWCAICSKTRLHFLRGVSYWGIYWPAWSSRITEWIFSAWWCNSSHTSNKVEFSKEILWRPFKQLPDKPIYPPWSPDLTPQMISCSQLRQTLFFNNQLLIDYLRNETMSQFMYQNTSSSCCKFY